MNNGQGIVNASAEDKDAFFKAYDASLDSVRFRAEKWATISTALTAIFAIVTPFASPTDFKDLEDRPQIAIGVFLLLALICIAFSLVAVLPVQLNVPEPLNVQGFAVRFQEAQQKVAAKEYTWLQWSVYSALVGIFFVTMAFGISLFGPTIPK